MLTKIGLIDAIFDSVDSAQLRYRREYKFGLREHKISPAEADVLVAIGDFEGMRPSVGDIADKLGVEVLPSRPLKRLRELGYAKREDDVKDDRIRRLSLTNEGLNAYAEILRVREKLAKSIGKTVTKQDLEATSRVLNAIKDLEGSP